MNKWQDAEKTIAKSQIFGNTNLSFDMFLYHLPFGYCLVIDKNKKYKIYKTIEWIRKP